jgi:transposase-like protein
MKSLNQIPSEVQIIKMIRKILFGKRLWCPKCKSYQILKYENRYRCKKCRVKFSLTSHSWLRGMKLSWQEFWAILDCYQRALSIQQTSAFACISEASIRQWYAKFRLNLVQKHYRLSGTVQMDEAYFRGSCLLLAKEVSTGKIVFEVIHGRHPNKSDAAVFVQNYVSPESTLQTDGSSIYKGVDKCWPVTHKVDIHKKFQFGLTSQIEGMFGVIRTFLRRTYHHIWNKYLPEYLCEFQNRFCTPEMFSSPLYYLRKTLSLCTI